MFKLCLPNDCRAKIYIQFNKRGRISTEIDGNPFFTSVIPDNLSKSQLSRAQSMVNHKYTPQVFAHFTPSMFSTQFTLISSDNVGLCRTTKVVAYAMNKQAQRYAREISLTG